MDEKKLIQTPSQTVGPYFAYGLTSEQYFYDFKSVFHPDMATDGSGLITISGRVYDGEGELIPDAMIELWQNDGGRALFGRCGTGMHPEGQFYFQTIKPDPVDAQAPFITVVVFMRGQLIHSFTRIYFDDEQALNALDDVLNTLPEEQRGTLLAKRVGDGAYEFNIRMQGPLETVFFDFSPNL